MPLFVCLVLLLAGVSVSAGEIGLVRPGAEWRYAAVGPVVRPPENWKEVSFDDSAWTSGISGFNSRPGGSPVTQEATLLPAGPEILGYCFRKRFTIADPSFIRTMLLRIDYEHGFVAYLNGVEIARRGLAGTDPVPLEAFATRHIRFQTENIDVTPGIAHLDAGENVLAVQVHRASEQDRDFCLVTELMANFMRAPHLQKMTSNSVLIAWQAIRNSQGRVEYGKSFDDIRSVTSAVFTWRHTVELQDLEPGTTYHYRVVVDSAPDAGASDWKTFRTLQPAGQPIRFAVIGDTGQATIPQYRIAEQLAASDLDLVMHVGDVVYPYFSTPQSDARCFSIYRDLFARAPIYIAMGNHDSLVIADYLSAFYLPTNNVNGSELFYSFDHGDARFIVVATDTTAGSRYHPGRPQYQWLENQLASAPQPWKFLFFHHPVRTSSVHISDDYLRDGVPDMFALQISVGALAARHGAQVIFNGHDHTYERFAIFDGLSSVISGGGGAALYARAVNTPGSDQFQSRNHHLIVEVDGPRMKMEAVGTSGEVFDRLYRSLEAGAATLYRSEWQTPMVENSSGVEDGNIPGQTFDFEGGAIPTLPGLRANLGRLRVANDATHLYVGLEQASIHPDQVIALFIENPRQPGVSDLRALGDGQLDTLSEGADGLDMLTNARFVNFRPTIGCLLGDELADTHARRHWRPGMRWGAGQGVFRLDAGFTTISSARLQQFNRSPQVGTQTWEQNADLIEVAIPLGELGNAAAPDTIRIGALVFADGGGTSLEPVIDTAVAGRSLTRGEDGVWVLEPIVVQLAREPSEVDPFDFRGQLVARDRVRFAWVSTEGVSYTIQFTTDLAQPFVDMDAPGLPLTAAGAATTFEAAVPADVATVFFRLRTLP